MVTDGESFSEQLVGGSARDQDYVVFACLLIGFCFVLLYLGEDGDRKSTSQHSHIYKNKFILSS